MALLFLFLLLGGGKSREGKTGWQQRANSVLAVLLIVRLSVFKFSLHRLFCKDKRNHCWWLKMQKVLIAIA